MKIITKTIIVILLASFHIETDAQSQDRLYIITENGLFGYIDKDGKTIIKPQFRAAGNFSEGLAPVRLNGTYGYINPQGQFIIPPRFDFALSYNDGIAKVYIDGKPYFIDREGNITFEHEFESISSFGENSYAKVMTPSKKYGMINRSGNLVVDTIFKNITTFYNGISVVQGLNNNPHPLDSKTRPVHEVGVIDSVGNWIVPYGKYMYIHDFQNGYTTASLIATDDQDELNSLEVIDETGKFRFTIPMKQWQFTYPMGGFYDSLAVIKINSVDPDTVKMWSSRERYDYRGVINKNGEILFSNPDWKDLTPFNYNRAFAETSDGAWFLINTKGEKVSAQSFDAILFDDNRDEAESLFQDGRAFVLTDKGWGAIDTNGNYVVEPKELPDFDVDELTRQGNFVLIEEDISQQRSGYRYLFGFWDTENETLVTPQFHYIDWNTLENDLIQGMQDDRLGYINTSGEWIWREPNDTTSSKQLNIDFMNRGYFYATSNDGRYPSGHGGWANSQNVSKKIVPDLNLTKNTLQVVISTNEKTIWQDEYEAIKLYVANTTGRKFYFDAQDSRLYLKIQAQDKNGEWKDIEYLPDSWCGNSYHTLFLAPHELWEFAMPIYHGDFKTKLRAVLQYKKRNKDTSPYTIYSSEIEGYVNPAQFWHKREYYPSGLMDPYND